MTAREAREERNENIAQKARRDEIIGELNEMLCRFIVCSPFIFIYFVYKFFHVCALFITPHRSLSLSFPFPIFHSHSHAFYLSMLWHFFYSSQFRSIAIFPLPTDNVYVNAQPDEFMFIYIL